MLSSWLTAWRALVQIFKYGDLEVIPMSRQDHKCNDATRNVQDMIQEYYVVPIGNEIKTARTYRSNCAMKVSANSSLAWYRCNGRIVIVLYRWFSEIQELSVSLYIIIARGPILSLIIQYLDIRILYSFSALVYPMKIQLSFFMAYFMVVRVFKPRVPWLVSDPILKILI